MQAPVPPEMNSAARVLRQRERSGLMVSMVFGLIMAAGLALGHVSTHHSKLEVLWVSLASGAISIYLLVLFWYAYHDRYLNLVGYLSQLPSIFILIFLPYTWYTSVGGYELVPASYLMKTSLPIWAYILILISGLALRPAYPLLLGGAFIAIWGGLITIVMRDKRTVVTADFVQNAFSPAIIPGYVSLYAVGALIIAGVLAWITHSYRRSIYQAAELEVASTELGRYFSPAVRDTIVSQQVSFGGVRVQAAVLFSDIRGFTAMSESLTAEETVRFLRAYHERMVEVIYRNGGTVDKFIGDGIMVTFGTPQPAADDATRAVRCAIEMQTALDALNAQTKTPVAMGIGIDFGDVIAGNIGSASRLEYTVIGDTVNTASRIESATKEFSQPLLFSEAVRNQLPADMRVTEVAEVQLRGKSKGIRLYTVA